MTKCDATMTSYLNFVSDKPKVRPFSFLVSFGLVELKFGAGVNF